MKRSIEPTTGAIIPIHDTNVGGSMPISSRYPSNNKLGGVPIGVKIPPILAP